MPGKRTPQGEYFIEYYSIGNSIKVTAIDPVTMTEVSIVGSPLVSQDALSRLAIRKLEYMLRKKSGVTDDTPPPDEGDTIV
jgi:hypothetical protein